MRHMSLAAGVIKDLTPNSDALSCKVGSHEGSIRALLPYDGDPAAYKPHGIVAQGSSVLLRGLQ